ncbi:MAG: hypothetical protein AAGI30_13910, partial [Planctomycetota bacterium]
FDESGNRLIDLRVATGRLNDLETSPSGNWWTLRTESNVTNNDYFLAGQGLTGRDVIEDTFFTFSSPGDLADGDSIADVGFRGMPINDNGFFTLVIDGLSDFLDPSRDALSTLKRLDSRVITGDAAAFGTTTVDGFAAEGQLLTDFATIPGFNADVVLGRTEIFLVDGVLPDPTDPINLIDNFVMRSIANDGSIVFDTGVNGTGIANRGGETNVSDFANDQVTFLGFGGAEPVVIGERNVTLLPNLYEGGSSTFRSFSNMSTDFKGTRWAAETTITLGAGVSRGNQLVIDGTIVTGQGDMVDGEPVTDLATVRMTPIGDVYAKVERTPTFQQLDENGDPVFLSDDSPTIRTLEDPKGGILLKNGAIHIRENDPVIPGSNRLWTDADRVAAEDDPDDTFPAFDAMGTFLGDFQRFGSDGQIPIGEIASNRRGDVLFVGDVDDQDPGTIGTFAFVLNSTRIVLTEGVEVEVDANNDGIPETYYTGMETVRFASRTFFQVGLSDDGYVYTLIDLLNTPTPAAVSFDDAGDPTPDTFDVDDSAFVGVAFLRFKAFDVLDIDRDGTVDPAVDIAALITAVTDLVPGAGDYNLSCVVDAFDLADGLNDFVPAP